MYLLYFRRIAQCTLENNGSTRRCTAGSDCHEQKKKVNGLCRIWVL